MKIKDLPEILAENHIRKSYYSLSEDDPPMIDCVVCLRKLSDKFVVYTFERGKIYDQKNFDTEDKACRHFLSEFDIPTR